MQDFLLFFEDFLKNSFSKEIMASLEDKKRELKILKESLNEQELLVKIPHLFPFYASKNICFTEAIRLWQAYALLNGGKRLRPLLAFSAWSLFFKDQKEALLELESSEEGQALLTLMLALEYVHAYSLVHDDLPCMDNDRWRRGLPTLHFLLDEATATLIGDSLLNKAMELMLSSSVLQFSHQLSYLLRDFFKSTGDSGMIAGQFLDFHFSDISKNVNFATLSDKEIELNLKNMQYLKTGQLIKVALNIGYTLGLLYFNNKKEAKEKVVSDESFTRKILDKINFMKKTPNFSLFAYHLGIFYQIQDDFLDENISLDFSYERDDALYSAFNIRSEKDNLGIDCLEKRFISQNIGKTKGKDVLQKKLTFLSVFDINKAKNIASLFYKSLFKQLEEIDKLGYNTASLSSLISLIRVRKS